MRLRLYWGNDKVDPKLNKALADWCERKITGGTGRGFGACTTLGIFEGQLLLGVVVYHNYVSKAGVIEVGGAADHPRWLTPSVLYEMFAFPFNELGCQMVVMRVSADNTRLAKILTRYGFDSYRIPRLRGRHEDEIVFTLTDDRWRNNGFHRKIVDHAERLS
jgi:RimJ/RimL family protein N-acetyltransferase